MSDNTGKREAIAKAVDEALTTAFSAAHKSTGEDEDEDTGKVLVMDFTPTKHRVTITDAVTLATRMGDDVVNGLNKYFAEQAFFLATNPAIEEAMKCKHCKLYPCVLNREYANMAALGTEMEGEGKGRKEIRYVLYNYFSYVYNG